MPEGEIESLLQPTEKVQDGGQREKKGKQGGVMHTENDLPSAFLV